MLPCLTSSPVRDRLKYLFDYRSEGIEFDATLEKLTELPNCAPPSDKKFDGIWDSVVTDIIPTGSPFSYEDEIYFDTLTLHTVTRTIAQLGLDVDDSPTDNSPSTTIAEPEQEIESIYNIPLAFLCVPSDATDLTDLIKIMNSRVPPFHLQLSPSATAFNFSPFSRPSTPATSVPDDFSSISEDDTESTGYYTPTDVSFEDDPVVSEPSNDLVDDKSSYDVSSSPESATLS